MSDQTQQPNPNKQLSLIKRLFSRRWVRSLGSALLVVIIAAVAYTVFGLVSGGTARLTLSPVAGNFQSGQQFTVGINLEPAPAPVLAATVVIKYNTAKLAPVLSGIQEGSAWSSGAQIVEKVTSPATGDPNYTEQLTVTVGQPTPGIQDSVSLPILSIPFRVVSSTDPAFASITYVAIDGSQSIVVKDSASGEDILGSVSSPAQYSVFPQTTTQSCSGTYPGAQVCVPSTLYYCPPQYRYPPPPGGWSEGGDCCRANQCAAYPTLSVIQGSESVDVVRQTNGQYSATFTWQTNIGTDLNTVETIPPGSQVLGSAASDGASLKHTLTVPNLPVDTTYSVIISVRRTIGSTTLSAQSKNILTFTTGNQNAVNRLIIYDLSTDSITNTSARISWTTNFLANGQVSCAPLCTVVLDGTIFSSRHDARILGLTKGTPYTVTVLSTMKAGINPEIIQRTASQSISFETTNLAIQNDANLILKVDRDRQCGTWMTCVSSISVQNKQKKSEEMCVALGLCDTLDPATGACLNLLSSVPGSSFNSTYNNPSATTIDLAGNLSGISKIANAWKGYSAVGLGDYEAQGHEPVSTLTELGSSVGVPNSTFENGAVFPWKQQPSGSASIALERDYDIGSTVLTVRPQSTVPTPETFGVSVSLGRDALAVGKGYYASFQVRANVDARSTTRDTKLRAQLIYLGDSNPTSNVPNSSFEVEVGSGWQQMVVGPFIPPTNLSNLGDVMFAILAPKGLSAYPPTAFMIDNVTVGPVLRAGPGIYIPRICRAYANGTSPACDYFDPFSGRLFRGWRGYCLMPDPKDPTQCLEWWPVDVVGSSPFAVDVPAGYLADGGRFPLYYCTEAEGNAPYVRSFPIHEQSPHCPRGSNSDEIYAPGGNCSSFFTFSGDQFRQTDIAAILIRWYFARDDGSCTLKNLEQTAFLSAENGFKTSVVSGAVSPTSLVTFNIKRNGDGSFSAQACSSDGSSAGTVWKIVADYRLREACQVVTQVVTPEGENKAQTDRVKVPLNLSACMRNPTSKECVHNYTIPNIGYWYGTDFAPFGAVVHPNPDADPSEWTTKLFIEPSIDSAGETLGQARGGQPYGVHVQGVFCRNNPSDTVCDPAQNAPISAGGGNNPTCEAGTPDACIYDPYDEYGGYKCQATGMPCSILNGDNDCNMDSNRVCEVPYGLNVGPRICVSGSEVGKDCNTNDDCGTDDTGNIGLCSGPEKPYSVESWDAYAKALAGNPKVPLSNLFVKTYGTWQWTGASYQQICAEDGIPVCVGGTNPGVVCGSSGVACAGGTCGYRKSTGGLSSDGICLGGNLPGATCQSSSQCGGVCVGGTQDGAICGAGTCSGGYNSGSACQSDGQCGGRCVGGQLDGIRCSTSGTCRGGGTCATGTCMNLVTCTGGTCASGVCSIGPALVGTGVCGDPAAAGGGKEYGWGPATLGVPRGIAPKVRNIRVNGLPEVTKVCPTETTCYTPPVSGYLAYVISASCDPDDYPFEGIETYPVTLTFNSNVNSNQLPLTRYTVDWGDGTVTSESDLQIKGKEDPKNPHTLGHLYQYKPGNPGCDAEKCTYQIRIQIEDNWGWCNENTANPACGLNQSSAWALFREANGQPQPIKIWKSESLFTQRHTCGPAIF